MSGRLVSFLFIFMLTLSSVYADEGDYLMGLSAYKDGLNDIARSGFTAYLADSPDKANKPYAEYLMYQILLEEGDSNGAYSYFQKIEHVQDARFDKELIKSDRIRILVLKDCSAAAKAIHETNSRGVVAYIDSSCPLDNETLKVIAATKDLPSIIKAVSKIQGNAEATLTLFNGLDIEKLTAEQAKYFGVLFYKNGMFDNFWKIYGKHSDADLANLALDRLWNVKDYAGFTKSFETNSKKFSLDSSAYCRAIEAYRNQGLNFECSLLDSCMKEKNAAFAKNKTACIIKSGKTDKLTEVVDSLSSSAVLGVCEFLPYMIDKNIYSGKSFGAFAGCANKYDIAELLLRKKRYSDLYAVSLKGTADKDYYYLASAYNGLGDKAKADAFAQKIKDKQLQSYLKEQLKQR